MNVVSFPSVTSHVRISFAKFVCASRLHFPDNKKLLTSTVDSADGKGTKNGPPDWSQTGHRMVTDWSQIGHRLDTDWSQNGHRLVTAGTIGYKVVTKWSQSGHRVVT